MLEPSYQSVHQVAFSEMQYTLDGKTPFALRARLLNKNTSIVGKSWSYLSSEIQNPTVTLKIDDPVGFVKYIWQRFA